MLIKKDGIYKTIDVKDYGIFQKSGWEKVVAEKVEVKKAIEIAEPIVNDEEIAVEEEPKIDELPKSKKKKK